jgi:hypothetical protein
LLNSGEPLSSLWIARCPNNGIERKRLLEIRPTLAPMSDERSTNVIILVTNLPVTTRYYAAKDFISDYVRV